MNQFEGLSTMSLIGGTGEGRPGFPRTKQLHENTFSWTDREPKLKVSKVSCLSKEGEPKLRHAVSKLQSTEKRTGWIV